MYKIKYMFILVNKYIKINMIQIIFYFNLLFYYLLLLLFYYYYLHSISSISHDISFYFLFLNNN
jgi:hypothetical protein